MFTIIDEHPSSDLSDIDICNSSPNSSMRQSSSIQTTSTPHQTYRPRVNFHSIESLVSSALNTSTSHSLSLLSSGKHDDTGYSSVNTSSSVILQKENISNLRSTERKTRRKLSDWQIWHLRQAYATNHYPTAIEQEQLAQQLLLPLSSVRIWFQNHRARAGRK